VLGSLAPKTLKARTHIKLKRRASRQPRLQALLSLLHPFTVVVLFGRDTIYTCGVEVNAATAQFRPLQSICSLAEVVDGAAVPGGGGVLHGAQVADPRGSLPAPAAEAVHVGFAALATDGAVATVVTAAAAVASEVNDTWHRQLSLQSHTHVKGTCSLKQVRQTNTKGRTKVNHKRRGGTKE